MYILKNAWISIKRNMGRNILIGLIILVISSACAITLAIRESASKIVKAYEKENPLEASIGMNREVLMNSLREGDKSQEEMINAFNDIANLTEEEINNYGDSKYLSSYYYTYSLSVDAKGLTEATDSLVKETTTTKTETSTTNFPGGFNMMPPSGNMPGSTTKKKTTTTKTEKIFNEKANDGAFTLLGYNSYEDMKEFIKGDYQITEGEVFSDFEGNYCVISEELATLNNLSLGDTITIIDPKTNSKTYTLEITGIYKENSDSSSNTSLMFTSSANNIITNVNFIKNMLENNDKLEATITPTFILNSKDDIENFAREVEEKGLSEYYQVETNLEDVENQTKSISNVKTFATTFLIITLIIGAIVLIVLNMINIRERKYEIGVLRTIGMKKSRVSLQFMLELLIVTLFGLALGSFLGSMCSVSIANHLMENEINNASNRFDNIKNNFGRMNSSVSDDKDLPQSEDFKNFNFGIANVEEVDSINAIVDINVLIKLLGIGLLLTFISSLASMMAISRFSPLTILKERS